MGYPHSALIKNTKLEMPDTLKSLYVILEKQDAILSIKSKLDKILVKIKNGNNPGKTAFANKRKPLVMLEEYLDGLDISKQMHPKTAKEIK